MSSVVNVGDACRVDVYTGDKSGMLGRAVRSRTLAGILVGRDVECV